MTRSERGFTLVELMVTMVVFVLTITAAANIFSSLLNQFKQQSKITETNIEGNVGLQMLRSDIEQAGYGLPYNLNGINYTGEAVNDAKTTYDDTQFNDGTANPPRAVQVGNNIGFNNAAVTPDAQSDVLVIKATNLDLSAAATKWAYVSNRGASNTIQPWNNVDGVKIPDENLENGDQVIVLNPVVGGTQRVLVSSGATFSTTFNEDAGVFTAAFQPVANSFESYLIYGISPGAGAAPRMPFNRADYYIGTPVTMPARCAPNTGVLYKALVNHADGSLRELPLLDCVAAMQVLFGLDTNNDGAVEPPPVEDLGGLTAENIRDQLKDIRIYILAQEGQRDMSYTSPSPITANDPDFGNVITFTIPAGDPRSNYRWKMYTLFIKPYNLR